jgi:proteasome accessory factor B
VSDIKTERLINLTMALLASKRYLTKAEIFASVAGYTGTQEAMDRMFERDKDDLRSLGISIDVGSIDAFFEDEQGYRIDPDRYSLKAPDISPEEFALISVAAHSWRNSLFSSNAQRALRKLESLGIETDPDLLKTTVLQLDETVVNFDVLWEGLDKRKVLQFHYASSNSTHEPQVRSVYPYGISLYKGSWYLGGLDIDKNEIRVFKVSRVIGEIKAVGRPNVFEVPEDFDLHGRILQRNDQPVQARFLARVGKVHGLRIDGSVSPHDDDWDIVDREFDYPAEILSAALWYGEDMVLLQPTEIRDQIVSIMAGRLQ